jgi:hypothetical protein
MTKMKIGGIATALFCSHAFAQYVGTKLGHAVVAVHGPGALKRLHSGLGSSMFGENGRIQLARKFRGAGQNFSVIQTLLS